jgi:pyrroloquinoline-quinone synthase
MQLLIAALAQRHAPQSIPYVRAVADGTLSRSAFVHSQQQFFHAVAFFPQPMGALVARLPDAAHRAALVRNMWEEHGEGDPARFHVATFDALLQRLGADSGAGKGGARVEAGPEVHAFNAALMGCCLLDPVAVGLCALGMIEHLFGGIGGALGAGMVARGWLHAEDVVHYPVHEALDVRHAQDLFAMAAPFWERGGEARTDVERGLRLGAHVFVRLYAELLERAQQDPG